jgi:predicted kinase
MKVITFMGLPAVGKSSLANIMHKRLNSVYLSTDWIRHKLFQHYYDQNRVPELYSDELRDVVYNAILTFIELAKDNVEYFIIDGTFDTLHRRSLLLSFLEDNEISSNHFWISCSDNTVMKRIIKRTKDGSLSDARIGEYLKLKKSHDPIQGDENITIIDSDLPKHENIRKIIGIIH